MLDRLPKQLAIGTVVCVISAAPSFFWAHHAFSEAGMAAGVGLFIVAYTLTTSTELFDRFRHIRGVELTLRIVYGLRLGASIIFPIGLALDVYPGMIAVTAVRGGPAGPDAGFNETLVITLIQGLLLNIELLLAALPIFVIVRAASRRRADDFIGPRGFEVVPVASGEAVPGSDVKSSVAQVARPTRVGTSHNVVGRVNR